MLLYEQLHPVALHSASHLLPLWSQRFHAQYVGPPVVAAALPPQKESWPTGIGGLSHDVEPLPVLEEVSAPPAPVAVEVVVEALLLAEELTAVVVDVTAPLVPLPALVATATAVGALPTERLDEWLAPPAPLTVVVVDVPAPPVPLTALVVG
jgi:hypothetical protein